MKGTVYILHGCPSSAERAMNPETRTYDKHWIPWTRDELTKRGYEVKTPMMPTPWDPDYEAFRKEFEKNSFSEDDILIGHSCGAAFLVRWLGDSKQKIEKLILVAPWKIAARKGTLREAYYNYEIDPSIRDRVKEVVIFTSDNEEEGGKESAKIFHEALGGKVIELRHHGHYTEDDMGTVEFPELLEIVG